MMLSSLLVASALALPSAAFMVVPQVHPLDPHNGRQVALDVKCPDCPFAVEKGSNLKWKDGFDSQLSLNFTTDGDTMLINGKQIFPMPNVPVELDTVLHRESDGKASPRVPLGYAFEHLPHSIKAQDADAEVLTFQFTVIDIAGLPVPVEPVRLEVLKVPEGDLFVAKAKVHVSPGGPTMCWRHCRRRPKCLRRLLLARIRSILAAAKARALNAAHRIAGKGGCHRKPHGLARPDHHHKGPHNLGHGPHRHHRGDFAHTFARGIRLIVVPAVLGLTAGVIACAVGMLVGQGIAALWIRFRRGSNSREITDAEQGAEDEKEPLVDDEYEGHEYDDLPPGYEDQDRGNIILPAEKE